MMHELKFEVISGCSKNRKSVFVLNVSDRFESKIGYNQCIKNLN